MFDIGFSEMFVIAAVALVVLGPERLPKVARQVGEWMGKLRRYVDDVKSDISRQMELEELRGLKQQVTDAAQSLKQSVDSVVGDTRKEFDSIQSTYDEVSSGQPPPPVTDWERVYATRRVRERYKDRRVERARELGHKRPKRSTHR